MFKKTLAWLLVLCMVVAMVPATAFATDEIVAVTDTNTTGGSTTDTETETDGYVAEVNGVKYDSLQKAINICTNGETVKLIADITYDTDDIVYAHGGATGFGNYDQYNPSIIYVGGTKGATPAENQPSNVNVVIDLNGHTITNNADAYLFLFMDNCKVTFTGEGSVVSNTNTPVIWVTGTDTLVTIESGKYVTANDEGLLHATHSGDLVINGGEFSTTADDASLLVMLNTKEFNNPNYFLKGQATVSISGGTFYGFNPTKVNDDSKTPFLVVDCCTEGTELIETDNAYLVVEDYAEWIKEQLLAGNDVTLYDDVVVDGSYIDSIPVAVNTYGQYFTPGIFNVVGDVDVTFDLNGHTITYNGHADAEYTATKYASDYPDGIINSCTVAHGLFFANNGGKLTIEGEGNVNVYGLASGVYAASPDSVITVKGGNWNNKGCATCGGTNLFLYASHGGEVYIEDGIFKQALDSSGASYLIVEHGGTASNEFLDFSKTKFIVTGGTFVGMNPKEAVYIEQAGWSTMNFSTTDVVAEGCFSVPVAGEVNTWTVTGGVVSVNGVMYGSWEEAMEALNPNLNPNWGYEVKDADIVLYDDIVDEGKIQYRPSGNNNIDLNGFDFYAYYTITVNGTLTITGDGTFNTGSDGYPLVIYGNVVVDPSVDFSGTVQFNNETQGNLIIGTEKALGANGKYKTTDATLRVVFTNGLEELSLSMGHVTLTKNDGTLADQKITIGKGTTFTVADGVYLNVDPTTVLTINGNVTGEGTVVVNSVEHLNQVLTETTVAKIALGTDLTTNIVATRDVTIDLNGKTLTGNIDGNCYNVKVIDSTVNETNKNYVEAGVVTGKELKNVELYAGTYYYNVSDLCADGYNAVANAKEDGTWTVMKVIVTVDGVPFTDWDEAKDYIKELQKTKGDFVIVLYADIVNDGVASKDGYFTFGKANQTYTLDLNGYNLTTKYLGHTTEFATLHITDSAGGGSFNIKGWAVIGANSVVDIDNNVVINGEIRISNTNGSTGRISVDGNMFIGKGHVNSSEEAWGAIFTTGGTIVLKGNFEEVKLVSGNYSLTENVTLLANANITVNAGVTLDLNGNVLSAASLTTFGDVVDNAGASEKGLLKVAKGDLRHLSAKNSMMPVWNENDGYFFINFTFNQKAPTVENGEFYYMFKPGLGSAALNAQYFADKEGTVDNGISIIIRFTWEDETGNTVGQDFTYSGDNVKNVYSSSRNAFTFSATGFDAYKNMTVSVVVESDLGVEQVCATHTLTSADSSETVETVE